MLTAINMQGKSGSISGRIFLKQDISQPEGEID